MTRRHVILGLLLGVGIAIYFLSGADALLTLVNLQAEQARFQAWLASDPVTVVGGFFLLYVLMAALSLPGATLLTLLGGALFGLGWGLVIISFASTLGATLAALIARTLARAPLETRFAPQLERINAGIRREGAFYLFTLRLIPLFPFFIINLLMGLTRLRLWTFYWVSQLGMLPGTAVYVNAGRELGSLQSLSDIFSPGLVGAFVLMGVFPWLARGLVAIAKRRRLARCHARPLRFDYDIVVIGGGSAGLVASYIAAALKARVALVERGRLGGDCLNTGCVPSKALVHAARVADEARRAHRYGIHVGEPRVDFAAVMAHVRRAIREVEPHDSRERYEALGVDVIAGTARLDDPWRIRVSHAGDERVCTTRHVIIASGAEPVIPPLAGLETIEVLTSENLWQLEVLPERLVVLGGGAIGCELGQSFARLGSQVSLIEVAPQLLPREDIDAADALRLRLEADGVALWLDTRAVRVVNEAPGTAHALEVERRLASGEVKIERLPFDRLLVAVGRKANVTGMGLEALGVEVRADGTLAVDESLQSVLPNVWACGDVAGPFQLTHASAHQAWHATVNALFGEFKRFRISYRALPVVTYTDPEVARVGLGEREARARGIDYEVTRYALAELDRAIIENRTEGFIKVLTVPGRDRILGAYVVGQGAGELLAEFTLAMTHNIGLNKLLGTVHPYPTWSEAAKASAGSWKNAHKPERLLTWLARYFAWRRGARRPEANNDSRRRNA